eukprot:scaffold123422_cov35-Attheya_sp.AAC.2
MARVSIHGTDRCRSATATALDKDTSSSCGRTCLKGKTPQYIKVIHFISMTLEHLYDAFPKCRHRASSRRVGTKAIYNKIIRRYNFFQIVLYVARHAKLTFFRGRSKAERKNPTVIARSRAFSQFIKPNTTKIHRANARDCRRSARARSSRRDTNAHKNVNGAHR